MLKSKLKSQRKNKGEPRGKEGAEVDIEIGVFEDRRVLGAYHNRNPWELRKVDDEVSDFPALLYILWWLALKLKAFLFGVSVHVYVYVYIYCELEFDPRVVKTNTANQPT